MLRRLIAIVVLSALAACATAPAYTPAATQGAVGYSDTPIESNRYFVTYRANGPVDAALVEDFALLRAAELTLQHGRDWFRVDRRTLDQTASGGGGPSIGVGIGGGSWGRRSGVGVGVGVTLPVGAPPGPRARSATLEIRLGEGPKPDDADAYDAHALVANLRARRLPPQ